MVYHPFRHLGLKFLSVAIAVALWFTVSGEQTVERSLRVPLELQNMPETLEIVDNPPATVDVRVRGASGMLSHLAIGDIVAVVDLSTARAGRKFFHLTREHVRVPYGVDVAQVSPGTISLMFEPQGQKPVPVVPVVEGEPAPGFVKGTVTVRPAEVEVVGPQSTLRFLREAVTEPVSIHGAKATLRETVTIGVNDTSLRLKTPANAEITVEVVPAIATRTLDSVPIQFRGQRPRGTAEATPSTVSVQVKGPHALVTALRPESLTALVDLAGVRPGRYNLPIRVEAPPDVVVVSTAPPKTGVRVR